MTRCIDRRLIALLILALALAIFAALPLFGNRFIPTHDGEYHIIRFWQFSKMLNTGYFFPRWAPDLNSGYGVPLFNFHYPFPNYVGSLFHALGWSFADSFQLTLAFGYLSSVVLCFLWLVKIFGKLASVFGTVIFSFVPYWFVDIYVRGSVGEVLAISFLLMAFVSVEYDRPLILAMATAGLILSHNILAMIFFPLLLSYVLMRNKNLFWMLGLGFGLSAYFWIPAIIEREYVTGLSAINWRDHFPIVSQLLVPSWGTGFSGPGFSYDEMSFQIGLVPLVVLVLGFPLTLIEKSKAIRQRAILFYVVTVVSFGLMLENSKLVWELLKPLAYLQYPWRLLSFFPLVTAFLAAFIATKIRNFWVLGTIAFISVAFAYQYSRPVTYDPRSDDYYLSKREFTDGTSSLGNSFSTRWTAWKRDRAKDKVEIISGNGTVRNQYSEPLIHRFVVDTETASIIRVNTLYYPGWRVEVDGTPRNIDYQTTGTISFAVDRGTQNVVVFFSETPLRLSADSLSILSLFWIIGSVILKLIYHEYRNRYYSSAK